MCGADLPWDSQREPKIVTEQGFTFPVLVWADAVAQRYHAPGTPFFHVINSEGTITAAGVTNTEMGLARLVDQR